MVKMKVILCALVLFAVIVVALADDVEEVFKPDEATIKARFRELDTDGDGQLSREEIKSYLLSNQHPDYKYESEDKVKQQLDALFASADKDKNQLLSVEEVIAYVKSPGYDFFGVKTGALPAPLPLSPPVTV